MSDPPGRQPAGHRLTPEQVSEHTFATSFRGYDSEEVRGFLSRLAAEMRSLQQVADDLRRQQDEAPPEVPAPVLDEAALTAAVGEEAARILRSAHEAALDLKAKAEEYAMRLRREAEDDAARLRAAAATVLTERTAEAEAASALLRRQADAEAETARVDARREAEAMVEEARVRGREVLTEAQAVRERVLSDLVRRRRTIQAQLEELRAGRELLIEALASARRTVDATADRLRKADSVTPSRDATAPDTPAVRSVPAEVPPAGPERAESGRAAGAAASDVEAVPPGNGGMEPAPPGGVSPGGAARVHSGVTRPPEVEKAVPAGRRDGPSTTEERRSSALRILRRAKPAPPPAEPVPAGPALDDGLESVRIIGPARPESEPDTGDATRPAVGEPVPVEPPAPPPVPAGPAGPAPATDASAAEAPPDAGPAPEAGLAPEAGPAPEAEPAAVEAVVVETPVADEVAPPPSEGAPPAVPPGEETPGPDRGEWGRPGPAAPARPNVDELFARLRAGQDQPEPVAEGRNGQPPVVASAPPGRAAPATGDDEGALQRRDIALDPVESGLTRKLKRALQDEQNVVLDRLRTQRGAPAADALLSPTDVEIERYRAVALPFLTDAVEAGAGGRLDAVPPAVAGELADVLAAELAEPLRERLGRVVREAVAEDADPSWITDRLSAVYRDWKNERVESLAAHAAISAFNRAAFEAAPGGARFRWVVDDGGRPCPDCDDNALAGPTPKGEPFPTGEPYPPAHVGCRCLLAADQ